MTNTTQDVFWSRTLQLGCSFFDDVSNQHRKSTEVWICSLWIR